MIKIKFLGKVSKCSFTKGLMYYAKKDKDIFGEFYNVLDDSGEWYRYSLDFVKNNFIM